MVGFRHSLIRNPAFYVGVWDLPCFLCQLYSQDHFPFSSKMPKQFQDQSHSLGEKTFLSSIIKHEPKAFMAAAARGMP